MNRPKGERFVSAAFFAGAALYFGAISVVSHIPGNVLAEYGWNFWDKAAHVVEYAPLGLLLTGCMKYGFKPMRSSSIFMFCMGSIAILGAIDEIHQYFVPGRFATVSDAVADVIGGCVGIGIGAWLLPNRGRRARA